MPAEILSLFWCNIHCNSLTCDVDRIKIIIFVIIIIIIINIIIIMFAKKKNILFGLHRTSCVRIFLAILYIY